MARENVFHSLAIKMEKLVDTATDVLVTVSTEIFVRNIVLVAVSTEVLVSINVLVTKMVRTCDGVLALIHLVSVTVFVSVLVMF